MKAFICGAIGFIGGGIAYLFGGWDASLITLLICMICDYITGLIVAGVFHKSKKTKTGNLESRAGWKGLCKKFVTLLFIIIANRLDVQMGTQMIRDAVCISFITNEILSIIENAGLMGIPLPEALTKAIAVLHEK
jgi:toxin secretion/phage lysis holin